MTDNSREEQLEPVRLIRQSGAIIRMGRLMLASGTASYRVKQAMQATARALGVTRHAAAVTLTEITATTHRGEIFRTEVAEVRSISINADRIAALDEYRRELEVAEPESLTSQDVADKLSEIERRGPLYPDWANAAFAGVACSAFAVLNNARFFEVVAVTVAATLGQLARRKLGVRGFNHVGQTMIASAVACLAYVLGVVGLAAIPGVDASLSSGLISAALFLVPGFAMVTGALDLAKLDFSAGIARTVFALMIFLSAAVSIGVVTTAIGFDPQAAGPYEVGTAATYLTRAAASALGVAGFAFMFNSPARIAWTAAAIGTVTNVGRYALVDAGVDKQSATVVACFAVGVLAATVARAVRSPNITLSVPATLIMIPGVAVYGALVAFGNGLTIESLASAVEATLTVLSIVMGLVIAKLVMDRTWARERH